MPLQENEQHPTTAKNKHRWRRVYIWPTQHGGTLCNCKVIKLWQVISRQVGQCTSCWAPPQASDASPHSLQRRSYMHILYLWLTDEENLRSEQCSDLPKVTAPGSKMEPGSELWSGKTYLHSILAIFFQKGAPSWGLGGKQNLEVSRASFSPLKVLTIMVKIKTLFFVLKILYFCMQKGLK